MNEGVVVFSKKVYNTGYSQAVTHPSTNPARNFSDQTRTGAFSVVWS